MDDHLTTQTQSTCQPDALAAVVEELHNEMLMLWGKRYADQWKDTDLEALLGFWAKHLRGYTPREIRRGRDSMQKLDWPPSLPEFKSLCRPPVEPLKAYYEAVAGCQERLRGEVGTWSHPAIFWASSRISFDLLNLTYSQVKERWERELNEELSKGEWQAISKPVLALSHSKQPTKEQAARALHSLKAESVFKSAPDGRDPKAWAKRILERAKNGDKTLLPIQVKFASEAINAPVE